MEIYAQVTAQVSEDFLKNVISLQGSRKEVIFKDIAKQAGLTRSYRGSESHWFLQGDLEGLSKAHSLLESIYEVLVNVESKPVGVESELCASNHGNPEEQEAGLDINMEEQSLNGDTELLEEAAEEKYETVSENEPHAQAHKQGLKLRIKRSVHKRKSSPRRTIPHQQKQHEGKKSNTDTSLPSTTTSRQAPKTRTRVTRQKEQSQAKPVKCEVKQEPLAQSSGMQRVFRVKAPRTCSVCSKAFSKLSNLYRHMKIAHQGLRFPCDQCQKKFTCKDSLDRHVKIVHEGLRCQACTVVFLSPKELATHQARDCPGDKSNLLIFTCNDCGRTYSRQSNLNKHIRVTHKGLMFSCEFCGRGYRSKEGLHEHQRHVHNMYRCSRCGVVSECELDFKSHMEDVHEESYTIRPPPKRKNHSTRTRTHRKRERRPASCTQCSKVYSSQSKLNNHIRVVHDHVRQHCDLCSKSFASKEQLKIHNRVFHEGVEFNCSMCTRTFINRVTLAKHQQAVHKQLVMDNVYQCEICGKSFLYECNLCRHKKLEHEGLRFTCKACNKEFRTKQKMQEHYTVEHEGHRFLCPHCPKMFKNKSKLKEHEISIHTTLKPHECFDCGEKFARRSSLNYHTKKKHTAGGIPTTPRKPKVEKPKKEKAKDNPTKEINHSSAADITNVSQTLLDALQGNFSDPPPQDDGACLKPGPSQEQMNPSRTEAAIFPRPVTSDRELQPLVVVKGNWNSERQSPPRQQPLAENNNVSPKQHTPQNVSQNFQAGHDSIINTLFLPTQEGQVSMDNTTTLQKIVHQQRPPQSTQMDSRQGTVTPVQTIDNHNTLRRNAVTSWSEVRPQVGLAPSLGQRLPQVTLYTPGETNQGMYNQALHNLIAQSISQCMPPAFGAPPQPPEANFTYAYPGINTGMVHQPPPPPPPPPQ